MRTVAVSWEPSAGRFVARGSHASHDIAINAPRRPDEERFSTGFSATELLLAGAGACSAWDVLEILRKRRHDIVSLDVTVDGEQAPDPPWAYQHITLHFRVAGHDLRRAVIERVVRLSCRRYCSVLATVAGVARIEATLELVSPDGSASGGRRPVALTPPTLAETVIVEAVVGPPVADED